MKRRNVTIPFVKALEKGDLEPQLTGDGQLMRAENVKVVERGRIEKRNGFSPLGGTAAGKWLGVHRNRPVLVGETVQVKDDAAIRSGSLDTVEARAGAGVSMSSDVVLANFNNTINKPEVLYQNDYQLLAYNVEGTGITFELSDRYSNGQVEKYAPSSLEVFPRLVPIAADDRVWGVFVDSSNDIAIVPVDTTGEGDIVTGSLNAFTGWPNADAAAPIDAVQVDDNIFMVVYKESGADKYVIGRVTVSGNTVSSNAYQQSGVITGIKFVTVCKWDTAEGLIVYFTEATPSDVRGVAYNTSLTVTQTDDSIATSADTLGQAACVASTLGSRAEVYWTEMEDDDGQRPMLFKGNFTAASGGATQDAKGGDCSLWCKPFADSAGRIFVGVHFTHGYTTLTTTISDPQRTYFLLEDQETFWPTPAGKWLVDIADEPDERTEKYLTGVCSPTLDGTDNFVVAGMELGKDHYASSWTGKGAVHAIAIDTAPATVNLHETLSELLIPGACPKIFDGQRVMEANFLTWPEHIETVEPDIADPGNHDNATWGGTGDVYYRAMYEVYDQDGNRYMSPLSVAVKHTLTDADHDIDVDVPTCKISHLVDLEEGSYTDNIKVVLYRIDAFGSAQYRRLAEADNDQDARVVTFTDLGFDDLTGWSNTGNEQEYTRDGNILPNYQPPPFDVATIWQNREMVVHAQFPDRLIVASKELTEGEGTFFGGTALYLPVDPRGGEIVALEGMSDRLAILKRRQIMMTSGQGWDESGAGQGFQPPYTISDGVGCKNEQSVVRTPVGVFFESDDCLYLIAPNFALKPIGRAVRRVTDAMTIVGSALMTEENQVVWFSTEGTVLVYNWLYDQWMTWTGLAAHSCAVADGVLFYRDTSTSVLYHTTDTWLDETTAIVPAIETGWLAPSGLDEIRVWEFRLMGYNLTSDHTLTIKIAYDHVLYWRDTKTVDFSSKTNEFGPDDQFGTGLAASYEDGALILLFKGVKTRCTSVRFRFEWSAS